MDPETARGCGVVAGGGADRQAIIAKGYSKTMVSRVANAIKTELKQPEIKPKQT